MATIHTCTTIKVICLTCQNKIVQAGVINLIVLLKARKNIDQRRTIWCTKPLQKKYHVPKYIIDVKELYSQWIITEYHKKCLTLIKIILKITRIKNIYSFFPKC